MGNSQSPKSKVDKGISIIGKLPQPFISQDEFSKQWMSWKASFLLFKAAINKDNDDKNKWGNMLLNIMGPIGLDIYSRFTFNSIDEKENIDILLEKFDEYYIFDIRKKKPREDIYEYINDLKSIAKEKHIQNEEILIKKKILTEIDNDRFTTAAKNILPTFTFSTDFKKLTLKEIAFIWILYSNNDLMKNCKRCGNDHGSDKCPALQKQCSKCNEWNHFSRRCPLIFINNCYYCGGSHFNKKCPAFNETCTKCKRQNHFSWKCQQGQILGCKFCALNHGASKSLCPAKDSVCTNCKAIGHFASVCNKRSTFHKH